MLDDIFVINHVAHTFNLSPPNVQPNKPAQALADGLSHAPDAFAMHGLPVSPREGRRTDWSIDLLAETIFLETDTDVAVHHTLPVYSWFKDGLAPHSKTIEALTNYPNRFLGYVAVDPVFLGVDKALEELDRQLDMSPPGIIGLKLYPAQVEPVRSWRMDDPEIAFPLFERARARGLKTVAVHKAVPFPGVPLNPYRCDDVDGAAVAFPDLNFIIVHAGMTFVEETAYVIGFYPNVYADLESTSWLAGTNPRVFENVMAQFVHWGGPKKIIYGDGGSLMCHSQRLLEAVLAFQFSDATCDQFGIEKLTRDDKALILGGNCARVCNLDISDLQGQIGNDSFEQTRSETGIQEPYSNWVKRLNGSKGANAVTRE